MMGDRIRMPENFRYKEAFLKGPPQHEPYDDFRIKHPPMPLSKRAKIFSPFAALRGFDREIVAKQVEYEEKHILSEGEIEELNRRLSILRNLTWNSRLVREKCDMTASIPMKGQIDSLNASVAAGILCYEIVRQRMN